MIEFNLLHTMSFTTKVKVQPPDGKSVSDFNREIDRIMEGIDYSKGYKEVLSALEGLGYKIEKVSSSYPDNPDLSFLDILKINSSEKEPL